MILITSQEVLIAIPPPTASQRPKRALPTTTSSSSSSTSTTTTNRNTTLRRPRSHAATLPTPPKPRKPMNISLMIQRKTLRPTTLPPLARTKQPRETNPVRPAPQQRVHDGQVRHDDRNKGLPAGPLAALDGAVRAGGEDYHGADYAGDYDEDGAAEED